MKPSRGTQLPDLHFQTTALSKISIEALHTMNADGSRTVDAHEPL